MPAPRSHISAFDDVGFSVAVYGIVALGLLVVAASAALPLLPIIHPQLGFTDIANPVVEWPWWALPVALVVALVLVHWLGSWHGWNAFIVYPYCMIIGWGVATLLYWVFGADGADALALGALLTSLSLGVLALLRHLFGRRMSWIVAAMGGMVLALAIGIGTFIAAHFSSIAVSEPVQGFVLFGGFFGVFYCVAMVERLAVKGAVKDPFAAAIEVMAGNAEAWANVIGDGLEHGWQAALHRAFWWWV